MLAVCRADVPNSTVSNVAFVDYDLDAGELGGHVTWTPPASSEEDEDNVTSYAVFVAASPTGGGSEVQVATCAVGTTSVPIGPDLAISPAEQYLLVAASNDDGLGPFTSIQLVDTDGSVVDLAFPDLDLDAGEIGGTVTWKEPASTSQILGYSAYLAEDTTPGAARSLLATLTVGSANSERQVPVPMETAMSSYTTIAVYATSTLGDQSTPATVEINDTEATVSAVSFSDVDLDPGQIGGEVLWSPPDDVQHVTFYKVHFASSAVSYIQYGVDVPVGTNSLQVAADTPLGYSHIEVYARSSEGWQTTPFSISLVDHSAVASDPVFSDLDLDLNELGGGVSWTPPADESRVQGYRVYFATHTNIVSGRWAQIGGDVPAGTHSASAPADTPNEEYEYVLVYAFSSLGAQSFAGMGSISDVSASVSNLLFVDYDLDLLEIGGFATWDEPSASLPVIGYSAYLAADAQGLSRSPVDVGLNVGTSSLAVPENTQHGGLLTLLVYTRSLLGEQTTPAHYTLIDVERSASALDFTDVDLDEGETGGTLTWSYYPSGFTSHIDAVRVYLAWDQNGAGRTQIGSDVLAGAREFVMPVDTDADNFTHLVIYFSSPYFEQSAPAYLAFTDVFSSVASVAFSDHDLDLGEIGGRVTWDPPVRDLSHVADYSVYLVDAGLSTRQLLQGGVQIGTNNIEIPAATPLGTWTSVAVYTNSLLGGEQTTPATGSILDVECLAENLTFIDQDLDAGEFGGSLTWDDPELFADRIVSYTVYLADDTAPGSSRTLIGGPFLQGTNEFVILPDTVYSTSSSYLVVHATSYLEEQATPSALPWVDSVASVSGLTAVDEDFDRDELGAAVSWSLPSDETLVIGYNVYLSEGATSGSSRLQLGSTLPPGTAAYTFLDVAAASYTHVAITSVSTLAEQTTPTFLELPDVIREAKSVQFDDMDLDLGDLGGAVSWTYDNNAGVVHYSVYLAESSTGSGRLLLGNGAQAVAVPFDTAAQSFSHIVVYSNSALAEQTTPAYVSISDYEVTITSVSFPDSDLDANEIGGEVTWTASDPLGRASSFTAYRSDDATGANRTSIPGQSSTSALVAENTVNDADYITVFATSTEEQTTPTAFLSIVDNAVLAENVRFIDTDFDAGEIGGEILWSAPAFDPMVSHYNVYLSFTATGSGRLSLGSTTLAAGASISKIAPRDLDFALYKYVTIYAASALYEQTTPAASAIDDIEAKVTDLEFIDDDLDANELGGYITWGPPGAGDVAEYAVYLAEAADGTGRSAPLATVANVGAATNSVLLPVETAIGSYSHVVVYTVSAVIGEQTTPEAFPIVDTAVQITNFEFLDVDLDPGHLGGYATWVPVDSYRVDRYIVYLAKNAQGEDPRLAAPGSAPVGTNQLLVPENTLVDPPPDLGVYPVSTRTHVVLYAASVLAEQTTPAQITPVADVERAVDSIVFPDRDLDLGEVGGTVSWTPPSVTTDVAGYNVYLSTSDASDREFAGAAATGTNEILIAAEFELKHYTHVAVYTRSSLFERTTPQTLALHDSSASVSAVSFHDQDYSSGLIEGPLMWHPPADIALVDHYTVYLAEDDPTVRQQLLPSTTISVGTNQITVPAGTATSGRWTQLLVYSASTLAEQTTPEVLPLVDVFHGRDLLHVGMESDTTPGAGVVIETFTYVGCYSAATGDAFGPTPLTGSATSPSDCAATCSVYEVFAYQDGVCVCTYAAAVTGSAFTSTARTSCDATCDAWSAADFPTLSTYFATLEGFCGGSSGTAVWSLYEQYDAVMALGQGVVDRTRGLWWQVVLVQNVFEGSGGIGAGGTSSESAYEQVASWTWHAHASSLSTGRAALPLHKDISQPAVGMVLDEMGENPRLLATGYSGDVISIPIGGAQPAQHLMVGAEFPGHTVDGTLVEPGGAPMMAFDERQQALYATQPIGGEDSELYRLPLYQEGDALYQFWRFVPTCGVTWCAVNELRFRFQGVELDMSGVTSSFFSDLSEPSLNSGALGFDFGQAVNIDEFSFSVPYNVTSDMAWTWILEGTNDNIRKCAVDDSLNLLLNDVYSQQAGETIDGRPAFRSTSGFVLHYSTTLFSWVLVKNGQLTMRCPRDVSEPHLMEMVPTPCVSWDGAEWLYDQNTTFDCYSNLWTRLHTMDEYYPSPPYGSAPLRWFPVSRNTVPWTRVASVEGHVGLLAFDPHDGYVAAVVTKDGSTGARAIGQAAGAGESYDACSSARNLSFEAFSGAAAETVPVDCNTTEFRVGSWVWPDASDALTLWFTCASDAEFQADQWEQRYVELQTDAAFGWNSGTLTLGRGDNPVLAQQVRILELAKQPTGASAQFLDGLLSYYQCAINSTSCTTVTGVDVHMIAEGEKCGCGTEITTLETHGFYKACYCLPDLPWPDGATSPCTSHSDFTLLAGIIMGMGPEPGRLLDLDLVLGQSWEVGVSDTATADAGIYYTQLSYAAGDLFDSLEFPSVVQITNATPSGCGYNPSACNLVGEIICTLGEPCVVRLNGTSLSTINGVKVIRSTYACVSSMEHPYLALFENLDNPHVGATREEPPLQAGYRPIHSFDMGTPTRGALAAVDVTEPGPGVYTLCWGHDPVGYSDGFGNYTSQAFHMDAGAFMVMGPFVMDFECSLHFPCTIAISGIGLASTNKVLLIDGTTARCGESGAGYPGAGFEHIINPASPQDTGDGTYNIYNVGSAYGLSGSSFRLCWAHDPPMFEENGGVVWDFSKHYRVEIDPDFTWVRFTATVDCLVGRECRITIYGIGMPPTSQVLLVTGDRGCGDGSATPVSIAGMVNPQQVIGQTVSLTKVGHYFFGTLEDEAPPYGFRICWGANPLTSSAAYFPMEVLYPAMYQPTTFFDKRVGGINVARLESAAGGRHNVLAVYGDTMRQIQRYDGREVVEEDIDDDIDVGLRRECCNQTGFLSTSMLEVLGFSVQSTAQVVVVSAPTDTFEASPLSVRNEVSAGLQCTDASSDCGQDFSGLPTDNTMVTGFRDIDNPYRSVAELMVMKAEKSAGPPWRRTWTTRRPPRYSDWEAHDCPVRDPHAACRLMTVLHSNSYRVSTLSPDRVITVFVDGAAEAGTARVADVAQYMSGVDKWEVSPTLFKYTFNAGITTNCAVTALSSTIALVVYSDEASSTVKARVLEVAADGVISMGDAIDIGTGNLTMDIDPGHFQDEDRNETWVYTPYHRRVSAMRLGSTTAMIAFSPIYSSAEALIIRVSGLTPEVVVRKTLLTDNADDIHILPLGTAGKALAVYRDEADGGVAKAQELDVFGDLTSLSLGIGPGSLNTLTPYRVQSLTGCALNASAALVAFRVLDGGTEVGRAAVINTKFAA